MLVMFSLNFLFFSVQRHPFKYCWIVVLKVTFTKLQDLVCFQWKFTPFHCFSIPHHHHICSFCIFHAPLFSERIKRFVAGGRRWLRVMRPHQHGWHRPFLERKPSHLAAAGTLDQPSMVTIEGHREHRALNQRNRHFPRLSFRKKRKRGFQIFPANRSSPPPHTRAYAPFRF